jgi:hypothetical protein
MTTTMTGTTTETEVTTIPHSTIASSRTAAAAGFVFVVLNVTGTFLPGAPPASDASAAKAAAYFRDHSGAIKAQQLLGGLGIVALMWWFGALWRVLSRAESERPRLAVVAAIALASGLGIALFSGAITATAAIRVDDVDTTHLLWSLSLVGFATAAFAIATFLVAACVVTYRANIAPRWTSYLGGLAAVAFLVGSLGTVSDSNVINSTGLVAFLAWCVWTLSMSVVMWRGTPPPSAEPR